MSDRRKSFVIHIDSLDILDDLTDEQAGQLFKAIKSHQNGQEIDLNPLIKIAFSPFKNQFARDDEKYQRIIERNKNNGLKGGRPKKVKNPEKPTGLSVNPEKPTGLSGNPEEPSKTQSPPTEPKKADSDSDSDSDSDLYTSPNGDDVNCKPVVKSKSQYPDEFEWLWANKPNREGANPKKQAYSACKARLKDGSTWREMAEGLVRYANYCKATGIMNSRMVQQMATFFGTKESFKETWEVTHAGNETNKSIAGTNEHGLSESKRRMLEARARRDAGTEAGRPSMGSDGGNVFEQVGEEEWRDCRPDVDSGAGDPF